MGKRKRSRPLREDHKRAKVEEKTVAPIKHPALSLYYRNILTLRDYLLVKLPTTSKTRRRKILSILPGTANLHPNHEEISISTLSQNRHCLSELLHNTLVCTVHEQISRPESSRIKDFEAFSQHVNPTAGSSICGSTSSLSELVDFAIWQLFHKTHPHAHRPPHMLCHGFQRPGNPRQANEDHCAVAGIRGLVSHYPNANVNALKGPSWSEVLSLLGNEGDRIMLDMVMDCGIFLAGHEGQGNYYQLSGRCWSVILLFNRGAHVLTQGLH